MEKRKTLLLINPANQLRKGFHINNATKCQPLSLGIIAALTPPGWKVKILDENYRAFRYYAADLVGITAFTSTAPRAYELAAIYRAKGIPVIMGGIHVSMLPDEGLQYVDSVVKGEAEPVWEQVIRDFEAGALKRLYFSSLDASIHQPKPRRELFHPGYITASVQTTRGCPMNCSFCSVSAFNGRHYRFRPIVDVLDELERIPQRFVFFIDDNIIGHNTESRERARELFQGILDRGIQKFWISQSSINFADDPDLMDLAYRSGLRMIFLGIESEDEESLKEANKKLNISRGATSYEKVFRSIQKHKIGVISGIIFGWDSDTPDSILKRADFCIKSSAASFQTSILTALPGTTLFEKMQAENRLLYTNFPEDWQRYDYFEPTLAHPTLSTEQLYQVILKAKRRIFSYPNIIRKIFRIFLMTREPMTTLVLGLNYWHYRNIFLIGGIAKKPK